MVILGIEHLGDGLRHGLVLGSLQVLAPGEQRHVHRAGGAGVPQPQRVHMVRTVARHHHVTGNGLHRRGIFVDDVEMTVLPEFPQRAAETDDLGLVGLWQQPCRADALPVVRQLYLLALHNLLLENTQLIADGVAGGGNFQCGHGIEIAGGQPPETAVAEARVRLQLKEVCRLEAHALQRFF